ncbi:MAG: CoA-disulfide reductase [bacterium]|jgi:NADPH-dependent 2,4-dienoyl-CoA reductase/sulfur reductase-like enzyme/rhodanese-related sulfurtransferase
MKVLVVGGVAGGASAAARIRRLDEDSEIILFERGEHVSFANCGLPYYVGEVIKEKEKLLVQTPESLRQRYRIDVRIRQEVVSVDRSARAVVVRDLTTGRQYRETYDKLILAPGAAPIRPNLPGFDAPNVFILRNIPDTYRVKDYVDQIGAGPAVVVGGGFIGLELAENLQQRGMDVTIVELSSQLAGALDYDMAALVHGHLKEKGINFRLEDGVKAIRPDGEGSIVELNSGKEIAAAMVVLGIGVRPETKLAVEAGLELGPRGGIKVDKTLRTNDPDIYAVGDAIEVSDYINGQTTLIPLAGPANKQARIAADNICGRPAEYEGTQGTAVMKVFELTVASTGNNEKLLRRLNIPYRKSYTHSASHADYYPGSSLISLKLLFAPDTGKILGAQAVGRSGVEKRIDVIATAIRAGMTVHDLEELELAYAPPYSSAKDPVNMAGYVAMNILKGDNPVIHWDEIASLDPAKTALLDVRTPEEVEEGTIPGSINISLDQLRERLTELPRDKEIVVFCRVGLRAYIAARLLTQSGFTAVRNLSGGWLTFSAAMTDY